MAVVGPLTLMVIRLFMSHISGKSTKDSKNVAIIGVYPFATFCLLLFSPFYLAFCFMMWLASGQKGFDTLLWIATKFSIPLYPVSQEDSRIERRVLKQKGARIVAICASGDRVLESMVSEPEQIIAVDLNPAQLALFDLKLASIKLLEYDDICSIFHSMDTDVLRKHLPVLMKHFRSKESIEFWQKYGAEYLNCLYNSGTSGFGMKIGQKVIEWGTGIDINIMIKQPELVPDLWNNEWRHTVHNLMQYIWHLPFAWNALMTPMRMALGVPPRQGSLRGNMSESPQAVMLYFDRIFGSKAFQHNTEFIAGQLGFYNPDVKPFWMEEDNVAILKKQVNKCHLRLGYFTEILRSLPDNSVDCLLLSDHMDWMSQSMILEEWDQIARVGDKGTEVMWRTSGLEEVCYPHCLSNLNYVNQAECDEFLDQEDRLPSYRHHHVILEEPDEMVFMPRRQVEPERSTWSDIKNLYYILSKAVRGHIMHLQGKEIENWSEFFYSGQAKTYDSFRHMMLHGRKKMMDVLPLEKGQVWADIGCGTGFNLEYLAEWITTDNVKHVYLVDYSPSMLEQAKLRVEAMGIADKCTFIECDCSKGIPKDTLPGVNMITFSYSLCMIPGWENALRSAVDSLAPGGFIGCCDFTESDEQFWLFRAFWKMWFSNDHVFLDGKHLEVMRECTEPRVDSLRWGTIPYVPFFLVPYYVFLGRKM